jgi:predicted Zn finger-like uncharacterized protein
MQITLSGATIMPITMTCPGCKALFRLPDELAGEQVRCQKCARLFVVPPLASGSPEEPVAAAEARAAETPVLATLVPDSPEDDVVVTLAEEQPTTTAKAPPGAKQPLPPERTASILAAIGLLILFLVGILASGTFAVVWVATHLAPPLPVSARPSLPHLKNQDFGFDGNKKDDLVFRDIDHFNKNFKRDGLPVVAQGIELRFDGRAIVLGRTDDVAGIDHGKWNNDGPYHLYRVRLQKGTTCDFDVRATGFVPRLQIYDGALKVADRWGTFPADRVTLSYRPNRTGDYLLWMTTKERVAGDFVLTIGPEQKAAPAMQSILVALDEAGNLEDQRAFAVGDPNLPGRGVSKAYLLRLEEGKKYRIEMLLGDAPTSVALFDGNEKPLANVVGKKDATVIHEVNRTDTYRVQVSAPQANDGAKYTLRISTVP